MRRYPPVPVFSEDFAVYGGAVRLRGVKPHQLQVEIIVGQRFAIQLDGVAIQLEHAAQAFKRRAKRSADVLAVPTGLHLIDIVLLR